MPSDVAVAQHGRGISALDFEGACNTGRVQAPEVVGRISAHKEMQDCGARGAAPGDGLNLEVAARKSLSVVAERGGGAAVV